MVPITHPFRKRREKDGATGIPLIAAMSGAHGYQTRMIQGAPITSSLPRLGSCLSPSSFVKDDIEVRRGENEPVIRDN
jgi:hypothetical protein